MSANAMTPPLVATPWEGRHWLPPMLEAEEAPLYGGAGLRASHARVHAALQAVSQWLEQQREEAQEYLDYLGEDTAEGVSEQAVVRQAEGALEVIAAKLSGTPSAHMVQDRHLSAVD